MNTYSDSKDFTSQMYVENENTFDVQHTSGGSYSINKSSVNYSKNYFLLNGEKTPYSSGALEWTDQFFIKGDTLNVWSNPSHTDAVLWVRHTN
jgi:hypothetical protein